MPPGNSSTKTSKKCTYCRKESCTGESRHFNRFPERTTVNIPDLGSTVVQTTSSGNILSSGIPAYAKRVGNLKQNIDGIRKESSESSFSSNSNGKVKVPIVSFSSSQTSQKAVILQDPLTVPASIAITSKLPERQQENYETLSAFPKTVQCIRALNAGCGVKEIHIKHSVSNVLEKESKNREKVDEISVLTLPEDKLKNDPRDKGEGNLDPVNSSSIEIGEKKLQFQATKEWSQKKEDGDKNFNKAVNKCTQDGAEWHSSIKVNYETNSNLYKKKHSNKALIYEGVVLQIVDHRTAMLKVAEKKGKPLKKAQWGHSDAEHKFVQLFVDHLLPSRHESAYPPNTLMKSVLCTGEILGLVCTDHNRPNSGFDLFAHEAWKTKNESVQNNNSIINDAESVISFASYSSLPGSDAQGSDSSRSRRRRRRNKKEILECESDDLSDVISQWLDQNEYLHTNNLSKKSTLIESCHYKGRVIELRLPYAFVVEVPVNGDVQPVFVFSNFFHPEGPNSSSVKQGVSIINLVCIDDEVVVIPVRNGKPKEGKFEWVAKKAWPIGNDPGSNPLNVTSVQNKSEQLIGMCGELLLKEERGIGKDCQGEQVDPLNNFKRPSPNAKGGHELNGVILTLQSDWGLVKEMGSGSTYVFTSKNAYLFGLCLKNYVLDDVLQEGQLVKFSLENSESGLINAQALWCGNKLPDFYSFKRSIIGYCHDRKIKLSIENSLVKHGEDFLSA